MIVSGKFNAINCKTGFVGSFTTDENDTIYVQTNISWIMDELSKREYYIESLPILLNLKPIEISEIGVEKYYTLDAMVFGD